jgi:protein SCO1/2
MRAMRGQCKIGWLIRLGAGALALTVSLGGGAAGHETDRDRHAAPARGIATTPVSKSVAAGLADKPAVNALALGGPFALIDHSGKPRSSREFRGAFMLVFFGYASCDGVCPIGLRGMVEVVDSLGDAADRIQPIFITVDPKRDTPEVLARFVPTLHPRLVGLTGSPEQLRGVAKAYHVPVKQLWAPPKGKPTFSHGSYIYLMRPDGGFASLFPPVMPVDAIAAAIRRHMAAWQGSGGRGSPR